MARRRFWNSRYESSWPAYVPVAERRRGAEREIAALRKKGREVTPVALGKGPIAKTFWGKAWCQNLESYSDYANRLPRGRSYVRGGNVVHLEIAEGKVEALVRGTRTYTVKIGIAALAAARWRAVVGACAGKVTSLVELLQGKLSKGVMEVVTRRDAGLFPSPKEIELSCSCPDWATMCKHVAAVMYGVGARLDDQPDLLFRLRKVDPGELLSKDSFARAAAPKVSGRTLDDGALAAVFGIEIDDGAPAAPVAPKRARPTPKTREDVPRSQRARAAAMTRVTLSDLAAAGARVSDVQGWLEAGELVPTREHGVYETTPATRARLLTRATRR